MTHPDSEIEAWRRKELAYLKKEFGRAYYLYCKKDRPDDPSRWTVLFHWYRQWWWRHLDLDFRSWLLSQPYVRYVGTAGNTPDTLLPYVTPENPAYYGWSIWYKDPEI
jgi:hypothetical protein